MSILLPSYPFSSVCKYDDIEDKKRYNNIRYKQYKTQQQIDKTINFIENNIKNNTIYIYTILFSIFSPYFFCALKIENNHYSYWLYRPKSAIIHLKSETTDLLRCSTYQKPSLAQKSHNIKLII